MTWLPLADRDAVLGLFPEQYANLREFHAAAWAMNDHALLEQGYRALAGSLGAPAPSPAPATETERAVVAYAEQFVLDANSVTSARNEELAEALSLRGLYQLVAALSAVEVVLRTCTLLGVDHALPRGEPSGGGEATAHEPPPSDGIGLRDWYRRVIDRPFARARAIYGASVVRLTGVDALTTEAVRLRNATFQQCRY